MGTSKRCELGDQRQNQRRLENRNLLNSAENGGLETKKKKLLLRGHNVHTLPKNGTVQLLARASPPPFENTFVHSYKSREKKI